MLLAVGGPRTTLDFFAPEGPQAGLNVAVSNYLGSGFTPLRLGRVVRASGVWTSSVNDHGDAALVFSRCCDAQCVTRSLWAAFRRNGQPSSTPLLLARRTGFPSVTIALNQRGDTLVAWDQHRPDHPGDQIRLRLRRADGTLTPTRLVAPSAVLPTPPR